MFVKDLDSLKYTELRKLAKSAGIKANQKVDKLMKALKEHYLETEDSQEDCPADLTSVDATPDKPGKTTGPRRLPGKVAKKTTGNKCESGSESEELTQELAADPAIAAMPRHRLHHARKKGIVGQVTSTSLPVRSPLSGPLQKMAASLAALRKATPSTSSSAKKSVETLPGSSVNAATTPASKAIKKRRRTFELDEPTLSAQNTPVLDDQSERRSTRQRTSQGDADSVVQQGEPAKKRVRKNTYDVEAAASPDGASDGSAEQAAASSSSSPATRAMIEEIDANLPSAERKQKLLSALDKKIKNKAPSPARQNSTAPPSQIPRFMAFLANKKTESQKPITPGNKDWTKIHKKEFSKFDSLDVYLERKQQRMDKLSGSAKRPSTVSTRRQGAKIVKPVTRLQVPVASVKPFVPVVTSTRNMTFNFLKTPVALKTPGPAAAAEVSPTPRKQGMPASASKFVGAGHRTTPFIFTGNNASQNTTVSSQKKNFDLKASLAKPLSWKPHTGRLQPVDCNKPQPTVPVVPVKQERPSRQAMASKSRPVNAKDIRRVKQLDRRNNQKYIDMMRRRGLMA